MPTAPDLQNGFIVNGIEAANAWSTRIQCVYTPAQGGGSQTYLSQECRFENVPFSAANKDGSQDIFKVLMPDRFLTFTQGGHFHQFLDRDSPIRKPGRGYVDLGDRFFLEPVSYPSWVSEVHCPEVEIEFISVNSLLLMMNERSIPVGQVYVRLLLEDGAGMYFPAGYVNFSNARYEPEKYVQSISGDVLFPFEGVMMCGYIACAVNEGGQSKVEFATKAFSSLSAHFRRQYGCDDGGDTVKFNDYYVGLVNTVFDVNAEVGFYRYVSS